MEYKHIRVETLKHENLLRVEVLSEDIDNPEIFYFRDIKGSEIKYFESMMKEKLTIRECLTLISELVHQRGNTSEALKYQDFEIFEEIFDAVVTNIITDIIPWYDFLELAFAMGKKSYSVLPWLLEQEMTMIWDLYHSMRAFLEKESEYIKQQSNSTSTD